MAGSRIKGITIELNGDSTKLQNALKSVNSEIKNTQAQLKDVEKLLKLDPGNTELLSQKQRLLTDAVSETKEKLETLKIAAEQANQALANGEISQQQYDGLQREIAETEAKLKDLESQAKQSETALQKLSATGEKLKGIGDSVSDAGTKLLPVTAAVTGLGVAAVKTAADLDSAMSKVSAVSGATGEDFDKLREKAREMGSKTKLSATEAAEAMNYMAMAGWKTEDMLSGIEGIMSLAAASGEELATTSDIVTDALTAFGLSAKDSGHFADILAAASSNANTNVSMMGETFTYCAPVAGALGYSVEDVAEAIGLMANAGIKSSQAGTALRTMLTKLQGDLKLSGAAFGEITIQTANADGSMRELGDILSDLRGAFSQMTESEAAASAEALVGKNAMSGFLAVMQAAPSDIEKLNSAISNCDGTASEMADTMQDNLTGQLTILKSQLEELAISIGDALMPTIRSIVSFIQGIVDKLNSMNEGTRNLVITIGLIAAALGPVLIVVGHLITAVGTIMTVLPKLGALLTTVKGAFSALNLTMLANPITLIIAGIAALVAAFVYLWNTSEEFRQFWIGLWDNIKAAAETVWNFLKSFFTSTWNGIKSIAEAVWNGIKAFFDSIWLGISNTINSVVTGISNFLTSAWNAIHNSISEILTGISGTVTQIWNSIKSTISNTVESIKTSVSSAFNSMWSGIKNTVSNIYTSIKEGFDKAVGFVKNLASDAYNWGADIINNIVKGIKACIGKVKDAVSSVAQTIKSYLHFSVPDVGPLTDFESWMPDFMKGLADGIEKSKYLVERAISGVSSEMVVNPSFNRFATAGEESAGGSFDVKGLADELKSALQGVSGSGGDIVIPVYLGGTMLDEVIVNAQKRNSLRSGGR